MPPFGILFSAAWIATSAFVPVVLNWHVCGVKQTVVEVATYQLLIVSCVVEAFPTKEEEAIKNAFFIQMPVVVALTPVVMPFKT